MDAPKTMRLTAVSSSAVLSTNTGDLPPSSSVTRRGKRIQRNKSGQSVSNTRTVRDRRREYRASLGVANTNSTKEGRQMHATDQQQTRTRNATWESRPASAVECASRR